MNSNHMNHNKPIIGNNESNPCTDILSDMEYLKHMIPHHQVAIDMSRSLIPLTSSDLLLNICRDIIRKQSYEIWEMEQMMEYTQSLFIKMSSKKDMIETNLDFYNPIMSKSADGSCNPLFFKPTDHSKMMIDMELTEKSYLEHMVPHHQVAIDMSKRLLLHTNNSYLLDFCRKLIIDQQGEIFYMNNLLKGDIDNLYKSELLSHKPLITKYNDIL